jgi:hypothetical protein
MSKEQRAHSYENLQTIFDAINQNEAHAYVKAQREIVRKETELSKLFNDDDD